MNTQRGAPAIRRATLTLRAHVSPRDITVKSKGSRSLPSDTRLAVPSDLNAGRAYISDRGHHARWTE